MICNLAPWRLKGMSTSSTVKAASSRSSSNTTAVARPSDNGQLCFFVVLSHGHLPACLPAKLPTYLHKYIRNNGFSDI